MTTVPHININGTSREELVRQQMNFLKTLDGAIEALKQAAPHGRDYITDEDYQKARVEYVERGGHLYRMRQEVENTLFEIME